MKRRSFFLSSQFTGIDDIMAAILIKALTYVSQHPSNTLKKCNYMDVISTFLYQTFH